MRVVSCLSVGYDVRLALGRLSLTVHTFVTVLRGGTHDRLYCCSHRTTRMADFYYRKGMSSDKLSELK